VRVAYLVSRFPHVSETFIVREMETVAQAGIEVSVLALFPAASHAGPVHPAAAPWVARLRRPTPLRGLAETARWAVRRPVATGRILATIVAGHRRAPAVLLRALATLPLAAAHARDVRRQRIDHVHAHYATYPALAAWIIRRLTGCPYSFTAHAHDLYVDRAMLGPKVAEAAEVVTISDYNRALILEETGRGARVVHCGVAADAIAFRPRLLPSEGPVQALCVASLQEYKGHRHLLHALAGLDRLRLTLVGDGPLRGELEALCAQLGIAERVRWLGSLTEDEVRRELEAAEVFVLPSVVAADGQMEGIPVALMEAMAHGVPVVATRLSGIPELVRDGRTGVLAEPADADSLRRALEGVLADPEAARRRAEEARRLVEAEFTLAQQGAAMAALLRGVPQAS